ncbi:MAG: hypothetical protein Q8Q73_16140 [Stagnimonas sp.]|nr:hypothetical protein [Stagnimonas sp.]
MHRLLTCSTPHFLLFACCLLSSCDGASTAPGGSAPPPVDGLVEYLLDSDLVNESSGLARSQKRDDVLWTLNDSGGATELYALSTEGKFLATLSIQGAPANLDWEDLVSYRQGGKDYLLIGDIGDNSAFRPVLNFYRVEEPALTPGATPQTLSAIATIYTAAYPTGPRDAESLAVDGEENMAYVLSKRDAQPTLYRFSLAAPLPVALPALMENLGPISIPRAPADYAGNVDSYNWTTAMDFDDSLRRAYVGSLINGYFWDRAEGETWAQAFARPPRGFDLPDYPQIEAGSFALGERGTVYITSESAPMPLARIRP